MVKLIVSDLDGTLVPESSFEINKEYIDVINKLVDNGIKFAIASGRYYLTAKKVMPELNNKIYIISSNGAKITYQDKTELSHCVDENLAKDIIKYARANVTKNIFVCNDDGYFADSNDEFMTNRMNTVLKDVGEIVDDITLCTKNVTKISFYLTENLKEACEIMKNKFGDMIQVFIAGPMWVDMVNKNATKGLATRYLQEKFGISKEETMGFGNSYNDIELLKCCNIACVTEDADDEVKKYATKIIKNVYNYGALEILKNLSK